VQLSLLAVLALVVGVLLLPRLLGGDDPAATSAADTAPVGAAPTGLSSPAPADTSAPAPPPPATGGSPAIPPPADSVSSEALVAGPGLPADVVEAWEAGDAIVLLIVRGKGIDDKLVSGSVRALSGDPGVSVFVAKAKHIARYSRITQAVGVSQVPALVVVRPRKTSGAVPQAQVSYGFRSAQSVVQAVDDALYEGRDDVPYHPG